MSEGHGERQSEPPRVLFTGFPGFLGSALVERLLSRGDGPVACLVQPQYRDLAEKRANELSGPDNGAIQLYEGDITEPGVGLDDATDELESITELYHLAAVYDLGVDNDLAEAVNVGGTEHVLDIAEQLAIDRFQYVSTCYVSGRYDGVFTEAHLDEGQTFNNAYERTKFEAERRVQARMADGLATTIYRPAIVVGDSNTGATDKYDGPYNLLRLIRRQPAICSLLTSLPGSKDAEMNVVPRDFVVDAIADLSRRDDTVDEVYQLCDPAPLSVPDFVDALADAVAHRVVSIPGNKTTTRWLLEVLSAGGWSIQPATVDYLDHPTRYACPNTRRALAGTDIQCPPFTSYVDQLVAFVRENPDIREEAMV